MRIEPLGTSLDIEGDWTDISKYQDKKILIKIKEWIQNGDPEANLENTFPVDYKEIEGQPHNSSPTISTSLGYVINTEILQDFVWENRDYLLPVKLRTKKAYRKALKRDDFGLMNKIFGEDFYIDHLHEGHYGFGETKYNIGPYPENYFISLDNSIMHIDSSTVDLTQSYFKTYWAEPGELSDAMKELESRLIPIFRKLFTKKHLFLLNQVIFKDVPGICIIRIGTWTKTYEEDTFELIPIVIGDDITSDDEPDMGIRLWYGKTISLPEYESETELITQSY